MGWRLLELLLSLVIGGVLAGITLLMAAFGVAILRQLGLVP